MQTSDISVVMCTYNGERFVEQQLRCILDQTLPPAEIIVCDDGSTDRTVEIVESVAQAADTPVRIHRNAERLGFAENFLAGCDRADHRYIAFSDQDDVWSSRKLEVAREALRREDAVLCVHAVEMIDSAGTVLGDNRDETGPTCVIPPLFSHPLGNFYGFTMMFDRTLLDRIPHDARGLDPHTPDVVLSHDRWVYFLASTFGRTVVLNDALAGYRQHDGQLFGATEDRTRAERIATKLATGQGQAQYLAKFAAHRVMLLESLAHEQGDAAALRAAVWWQRLESHFERRARLFDEMRALRRFGALLQAVRHGVYRSFPRGGLGSRRFLEDLVVTVMKATGA